MVGKVDLGKLVGGIRPAVNKWLQTGMAGPIPVGEFLPLQSLGPDEERLLTLVQDYADTVLRLRSGAQINEQEFARMLSFLMSPAVRPETFLARLSAQRDLLRAREEAYRGALGGAGYRAPQVPTPRLAPAEAPAAAPPTPNAVNAAKKVLGLD